VDDPVKITFVAARPWLRRTGIGALLLIGLVIGTWLYVKTTPPVLGRIVDATTGQVIEGRVCEGMEYAGWGWTTRTTHFETFSRNGWFYLSPHFGARPLGRWIVFNDLSGRCGRDVGLALDFDFNDVTHTLRSGGYFPVVLEQNKHDGGYHVWPATWRTIGLPLFVTVPMVPHLKDVGECAAIADAALHEQCRQLNTYLASMESIAAGADEPHGSDALAMCDQLAPETVVSLCEKNVKYLTGLDAAKRAQDAAIRFSRERDTGTNNVPLVSIEELFPRMVSGIPRTDWDITENGVGSGRAGYSAKYARSRNPKVSANVSVNEFRDGQHARDGLKESCGDFSRVELRPASEEERSQEYILRRRTKPQALCWLSGKRVVQIEFLSGSDTDFVEAFLRKFARP
jgi:hypothetical protein